MHVSLQQVCLLCDFCVLCLGCAVLCVCMQPVACSMTCLSVCLCGCHVAPVADFVGEQEAPPLVQT